VYSRFKLAVSFFRYYVTAANGRGHGIHSPFIYDFIRNVLNDHRHYPAYDQVEKLRSELLRRTATVKVRDFGAGSSVDRSNERSIASIAKNAAKPRKYGQLLHRMVKKYQPQYILELGSSLGITTAYLSIAHPAAKLTTMEGAPAIADLARKNFQHLGLGNVQFVEGNFDDVLEGVIRQMPSVDFCFVDGNHRYEPTVRYFNQLLEKHHADSIFVFDDIHWSAEMEQAWQTIKSHPAVRCSVDLFFIGIVFFRKEFMEKQDFVIRY
jgi:predicted O-methyltransferase YrrM